MYEVDPTYKISQALTQDEQITVHVDSEASFADEESSVAEVIEKKKKERVKKREEK